ncbi:MAG: ATP-binding protein [Treponema sp.]|nr:ATP-binding protein [Treponema sp.]MBQ3800166.1 ATP-binding protein [Treponema sp.]
MAITETVDGLRAVMERKLAALPERVRLWTSEYTQKNSIPRNMLLTGQRGTGKTTFLLHHARLSGERMLYFSADSPRLASESLYDLAAEAFMQGYGGVIIDEVHFARDWSRCLKSLYDDFPDRKVWASDSSALVLRAGTADLSRRYVFVRMPLMSFREFLFLETGNVCAPVNPFDSEFSGKLPVQPDAGLLGLFEEYKRFGTRPFYMEGNYEERSLALLEKTLNSDVPFFVPSITDDNIRLMTAVVGTLSAASIPRLQVRSLCSDWNVSADKLYQLLAVMEAVGALRMVRFQNDSKAKSAGAKLFLADPCLYSVLHGNAGSQREAFVTALLEDAGFSVHACRDETEGDFMVLKSSGPIARGNESPLKIEVGGRNKVLKKSDWVIRDGTDYPTDKVIPLWLLAMMW